MNAKQAYERCTCWCNSHAPNWQATYGVYPVEWLEDSMTDYFRVSGADRVIEVMRHYDEDADEYSYSLWDVTIGEPTPLQCVPDDFLNSVSPEES